MGLQVNFYSRFAAATLLLKKSGIIAILIACARSNVGILLNRIKLAPHLSLRPQSIAIASLWFVEFYPVKQYMACGQKREYA
jgi:hypothetical protein